MLYWLLRWAWPDITEGTGAINVMQGNMSRDQFRRRIRQYDPEATIDRSLAKEFCRGLKAEDKKVRLDRGLTRKRQFRDLCDRFGYSRKHVPLEDRQDRNAFIGELRNLLAATCIRALEPDLIILDEFQRFKSLLRPDDPAGSLAHHLFAWGQARVLLLSATPYKMYTLQHESADDDHYADFVETLRFLLGDASRTAEIEQLLLEYRRATYQLGRDGVEHIRGVKAGLQHRLRQVIARTERLAVTTDRSGMLREMDGAQPNLTVDHVRGYLDTQRLARAIDQPDVIEYWKSAPYLLNFMEDYQLKQALRRQIAQDSGRTLAEVLLQSPRSILPWERWQRYGQVDPANPRLAALIDQTVGQGWWRLLWVPPSLPYYRLAGPFAEVDASTVTKRLVFSSWHVVPRALSTLLSYEADRQMVLSFEPGAVNTPEARERRRPLLMFTLSQERLTGMPVLAMLYPSMALASLGDPLTLLSNGSTHDPLDLGDVLALLAARLGERLTSLTAHATKSGPEDETWYWAAPILLDVADHPEAVRAWFEDVDALADAWAISEDTGGGERWKDHLREARRVAYGEMVPEGRPPEDLSRSA